ncbi:ankyrin repeat-containing domain protein [Cladochytrium replicatum]|nr:ankyrin repeat-containing domain protein [Cladochytrium replicatum]
MEEEDNPQMADMITLIRDPSTMHIALNITIGVQSVEDTRFVVDKLGKVVVYVGDNLTLLHQAAQYNRDDIVEFLLSRGHPIDPRTSRGETPLDQAAWKGCYEVALELVRGGADVDNQTESGYTPLHRCAFYNHRRLASSLLLLGADPTLRDKEGETPFDVATRKNPGMAEILNPMWTMVDGQHISMMKLMYEKNNPRHPEHKAGAREAFFRLRDNEQTFSS